MFDLSGGSLIHRIPELEDVFAEPLGLGGHISFVERRAGVEQPAHVVGQHHPVDVYFVFADWPSSQAISLPMMTSSAHAHQAANGVPSGKSMIWRTPSAETPTDSGNHVSED